MNKEDTYDPGPETSYMDRLSPLEERIQRESKLVYDDIFGPCEEELREERS